MGSSDYSRNDVELGESSGKFMLCNFRWDYRMDIYTSFQNTMQWSDSDDFVLSSSVSVRGCGAVICIIKAEKGKRKAHINL